jgi:hypothetical protein
VECKFSKIDSYAQIQRVGNRISLLLQALLLKDGILNPINIGNYTRILKIANETCNKHIGNISAVSFDL